MLPKINQSIILIAEKVMVLLSVPLSNSILKLKILRSTQKGLGPES